MSHIEDHHGIMSGSIDDILFPAHFLWGTATSAYQVEGAINEDGRGPSIWDQFAATPGAVSQGDTGDVAVDHYHRMPQDVALMGTMGLNSYCFSIAWPRILPKGAGAVNVKGLDFYARLIDELLERGITPVVKLYHWDLPLALHERGGWTNRDTALAFADYAEVVARCLGDRVPYWITHNEPWCAAFLGYGIALHAPGVRDMQAAVDAGHHLLLSHGLAMARLRAEARTDARLGIALNLYPAYPADDRMETLEGVNHVDALKNRWFLDPLFRASYPEKFFEAFRVTPPPVQQGDLEIISVPLDFLGVNYYSRTLVRARDILDGHAFPFEEISAIPGSFYTASGWEVYPQGLTDLLLRLQRDYAPPPILITENGSAFVDEWDNSAETISDPQRLAFLRSHIQAVALARQQGVAVDGYFAWSFMDNFEWSEGYSKRFGLVYVDYPTQRRIVKESGHWYASFLADQRARKHSTR